jgi:CheY-like chemotaxis protein
MDFVMMQRPAGSETCPLNPAHALHVLVADDDPASRRYLVDGLRTLGVQAQSCADGMAAIALARAEAFDLLLLDCHMPGAGARQILSMLRADPAAASADSIGVATTAELEPADRQRLLAQGFSDILLKPCELADLRRMLALLPTDRQRLPVLDNAAALLASGDAATMQALRGLLRDELVAVYRELDHLSADTSAFNDRLHRLRSSCGFCGASALSSQVMALQRHLALDHGAAAAALARFRHALLTTLEALEPPRS